MDITGISWQHLMVGLVSVIVVLLLGMVKRGIDNILFGKRHPVAGVYLTSYEEEVDGRVIWRSGRAVLKQKGNKIHGFTKRSDNDREWYLEGRISEEGHVYGMYCGTDPHDKSMGSFFLLLEDSGVMEGMWSGYGKVNNKLVSGRYFFNPIGVKATLKELDEHCIPSIVAISDDLLGKDYLTVQELNQAIEKDGKFFAKVALNSKNEVMGFYVGIIMPPEELKAYLRVPPEDYPQALNYAKSVGLIKIVAVREDFQRRGTGTELTEDCVKEFRNRQVSSMCCIGWRSGKGINIGGILKNCNFKEYKEISNYWKEDSLQKNYHCSDCGAPPCRCSAMVYVKYK